MAQQDTADKEKCSGATQAAITLDQDLSGPGTERTPSTTLWDNEPANPKNWPSSKKWITTVLMSTFMFFTLLVSTMAAPVLPSIRRDLKIKSEVDTQIVLSIYIVAYTIGSLVFSPLSETFGRVPVLHSTNILFLIFNTVCGFTRSENLMIAGRLLSGLGGSGSLALNAGLLGDCWRPEQRGRSIATYSFIPLIGPALGPVAGGFIADYTTWRWTFWSISIAQAVMQIAAFVLINETYHPTIKRRMRKNVQKGRIEAPQSEHETTIPRPPLGIGLLRPLRLMTTQPIIIVISLYVAWQYGTLWLMFASIYSLFSTKYGLSIHIASLCYLSIGLGFFLGIRVTSFFTDRIYARYKVRDNGHVEPEKRLLLMFPASLLPPIGLLIYGWTAEVHLYPAIPNIGICTLGIGFTIGVQCLTAYVVDIYPHYTASAVTAAAALRYFAGFGFPLFAPQLYQKLGYGLGNTLLAGLAFGVGLPGVMILWKYGSWLRARSRYAAGESEE
ncbi:MAG: hypothetical protein Q9160_000410 [Pyrenula sp. 1 TL-2023]